MEYMFNNWREKCPATNKKIKAGFMSYLREKLTNGLDICNIHELKFSESLLGKEALADKYTRQLIEPAMIVGHRKRGFTVLDF